MTTSDIDNQKHYNTVFYPEATLDAVHALFLALDEPERLPYKAFANEYGSGNTIDQEREIVYGAHPIFGLMEHFPANDRGNAGYTGNTYRGDHSSIPVVLENGEVAVHEYSFHKGLTIDEYVVFPAVKKTIKDELAQLLINLETR